jgi:hypothetical protein
MIEEQYKDAYDKAPEQTKRAIESFSKEPKQVRDSKPLLYYVLGSGTPPYKMSKEASAYVDKASGKQNCGNCIFAFQSVVTKNYICSQIRGNIRLAGWCKLWKR